MPTLTKRSTLFYAGPQGSPNHFSQGVTNAATIRRSPWRYACLALLLCGCGDPLGDDVPPASLGGSASSTPPARPPSPGQLGAYGITLSAHQITAGEWLEARCEAAAGSPSSTGRAPPVVPRIWPAASEERTISTGRKAFWLIEAGDYEVVCVLRAEPLRRISPPRRVRVIPGPLAVTVALADPEVATPTQPVSIRCAAMDAFGNTIAPSDAPGGGLQAVVQDAPEMGPPAGGTGWVLSDGTLSAERAGVYVVACAPMGASVGQHPAPVQEGVQVQIIPGLAAAWDVDLRDGSCLRPGDMLTVPYSVRDAWGNLIPDVDLHLITQPPDALRYDADARLIVAAEGEITVTLAPTGHTESGLPLPAATATLRSDGTGPELEVLELRLGGERVVPLERGAMIRGGTLGTDVAAITVRAVDAHGSVSELMIGTGTDDPGRSVGDATARQGSSERIATVELASRWGINMITAFAEDACGNRSYLAQSYLRSPEYFPAAASADEPEAVVRRAVGMRLRQPILDDQQRDSLDDVASWVEAVLGHIDFRDFIDISGPLAVQKVQRPCAGRQSWIEMDYAVSLASDRAVVVEQPSLGRLAVVHDAMVLSAAVGQVDVPLDVSARIVSCLDGRGPMRTEPLTFAASAGLRSAALDTTVALRLHGQRVAAEFSDFDVRLQSPGVNLECGDLQEACDTVSQTLSWFIEDDLERMLQRAVVETAGPIVEQMLADLTYRTAIATHGPARAQVQIASGAERITLSGSALGHGTAEIELFAQLIAAGAGLPANRLRSAFGAARMGGEPLPERLPMQPDQTFALALSTDFLNQALWAAWYAGAFRVTDAIAAVPGDLDLPGLRVDVDLLLPPVLMSGDEGDIARLGVGDARITARVDLGELLDRAPQLPLPADGLPRHIIEFEAYGSGVIGAQIAIDDAGEALALSFPEPFDIRFQISRSDLPQLHAFLSHLCEEMAATVLPQLLTSTLGSIPLPSIDTSPWTGSAHRLRLHAATVDVQRGHTRIAGRLVGTTTTHDPVSESGARNDPTDGP